MIIAFICAEFLMTVSPQNLLYPVNLKTCVSSVKFYEGGDNDHGFAALSIGQIHLNINHWNAISFARKRELLFHEMGHLFLGLHHSLDVYPAHIPRIMRDRLYGVDTTNWNYLVKGFLCEIEESRGRKQSGQCY